MKNVNVMIFPYFRLIFSCLLLTIVTACGPADTPTSTATPPSPTTNESPTTSEEQTPAQDEAYPGAASADSAYPGAASDETASGYPAGSDEQPQEFLSEPPNPEVDIPAPQGGSGAIGGVLVQEVVGEGFLPFNPFELILAEMVLNNEGQPALVSYDEQSLRAETFPTGIFVFTNVPPGTYALIVNTAVSQFSLGMEGGEDLLITVEPGQAIDLGQVFVPSP
jgi:hypothetical protein